MRSARLDFHNRRENVQLRYSYFIKKYSFSSTIFASIELNSSSFPETCLINKMEFSPFIPLKIISPSLLSVLQPTTTLKKHVLYPQLGAVIIFPNPDSNIPHPYKSWRPHGVVAGGTPSRELTNK